MQAPAQRLAILLPLSIFLASLAATAAARPLEPYRGYAGLGPQAPAAARARGAAAGPHTHTFRSADEAGIVTFLHYEIGEMAPDVVSLDVSPEVEAVACGPGWLRVSFDARHPASPPPGTPPPRWRAGAIVVGGPQWNCSAALNEPPACIYRRVVGVAAEPRAAAAAAVAALLLQTEDVGLQEIFGDLHVTFYTDRLRPSDADADAHTGRPWWQRERPQPSGEAPSDASASSVPPAPPAPAPPLQLDGAGSAASAPAAQGATRRKLLWPQWVEWVGSAVTHVVVDRVINHPIVIGAKAVAYVIQQATGIKAYDAIVAAEEFAKSGDLRGGASIEVTAMNYNYDPDTKHARETLTFKGEELRKWAWKDVDTETRLTLQGAWSVTCHDCFAYLGIGVRFELDVAKYNVERMLLKASGKFTAKLDATVEAAASATYTFLRKNIKEGKILPDIVFSIGLVPISLSTSWSVDLGVEVRVNMEGSLRIAGSGSFEASLGVEYTSKMNRWEPIMEQKIQVIPFAIRDAHFAADVTISPYIVPKIKIALQPVKVIEIGSVEISMKIRPEVTLFFNAEDCPLGFSTQLQLSLIPYIQPAISLQLSSDVTRNLPQVIQDQLKKKELRYTPEKPKQVTKAFEHMDIPSGSRCLWSPNFARANSSQNATGAAGAAAGCSEGALKLVEFARMRTAASTTGRLYVCHNNEWGTIATCKGGWAAHVAVLACKQLGYATGAFSSVSAARSAGVPEADIPGLRTERVWLDQDGLYCRGSESRLWDCSLLGWGRSPCQHATDALVQCYTGAAARPTPLPTAGSSGAPSPTPEPGTCPASMEGRLRLQGGTPLAGRLEICHARRWGTVCDDRFGDTDAEVACRDLGFARAPEDGDSRRNQYGGGSELAPIWLDDVDCTGEESTLAACSRPGWAVHDCEHAEDVSVFCDYAPTLVPSSVSSGAETGAGGAGTLQAPLAACTAASEGVVRLADGPTPAAGRVEICHDSEWGTVCDDAFGLETARVVCRQLGYPRAISFLEGAFFGEGEGPIHLDGMLCTGQETGLAACPNPGWGVQDCDHDEDASVVCGALDPASLVNASRALPTNASSGVGPPCNATSEGSVRLLDGLSARSGRVEICHDNLWGTVCDDNWDESAGLVVCRQLGYPGLDRVLGEAYFGPGQGPTWLDGFACGGWELSLALCSIPLYGFHDCTHLEDAGLICSEVEAPANSNSTAGPGPGTSSCTEREEGSLRLANGVGRNSGRVEVCHGSRWGTICDDNVEEQAAAVICRQLGFRGGAVRIASGAAAGFGFGSGPILMDGMRCSGSEQRLVDCPFPGFSVHDCSHSEDVGIECSNSTSAGGQGPVVRVTGNCTSSLEGELRLVGGPVASAGRVEICHADQWGTVCDDDWTYRSANVACRQLGYYLGAALTDGSVYTYFGAGPAAAPIHLDGFVCSGTEARLEDCTRLVDYGVNDCSHEEDASVRCLTPASASGSANATSSNATSAIACTVEGSLRLMSLATPAQSAGRVEICHGAQWGTVCDDDFNQAAANTACRQLGFASAASFVHSYSYGFGVGSGPIHLDNFACTGLESGLAGCQHTSAWGVSDCSHSEDVAVYCQGSRPASNSSAPASNSSTTTGGGTGSAPNTTECTASNQGAVRLRQGPSIYAGRVEICNNREWGTVCDDNFNLAAGSVVCRQLGLGAALAVHDSAYYGQGSGRIWLDGFTCQGSEAQLASCHNPDGFGVNNCGHHEDAGVDCDIPVPECTASNQGAVMLRRGPSIYAGRVEICNNREWGTVCDDNFNLAAGSVVCRQLGFGAALAVHDSAYYGQGSGRIWLDGFTCQGFEGRLSACSTPDGFGVNNCGHHEDAGVDCDILVPECTASNQGAVMLRRGPSIYAGRVEICNNREWGTVCDDNFNLAAGSVVCRQLGFGAALAIRSSAYYGQGSGRIWLDGFTCQGWESQLGGCYNPDGFGVNNCGHHEDAGVDCEVPGANANRTASRPSPTPLATGSPTATPTPSPPVGSCGSVPQYTVRLSNGASGMVQVCYAGQWGTVCDDNFDANAAAVVCRQLGYTAVSNFAGSAAYGVGTGPIHLDGFTCLGTEPRLSQCQIPQWDMHNCQHSEDAGVACGYLPPPTPTPRPTPTPSPRPSFTPTPLPVRVCPRDGAVRLVGGTASNNGRIEICHDEQWGTICDDDFNWNAARVACRSLGYPAASPSPSPVSSAGYGQGSGPIWLDGFSCAGSESDLTQCANVAGRWGQHNCQHSEDAGVVCPLPTPTPRPSPTATPPPTPTPASSSIAASLYACMSYQEGKLRLVGANFFTNPLAGRVEVCHAGFWGTVCDDDFNWAAANIVCRQVVSSSSYALEMGNLAGAAAQTIWLDGFTCAGVEATIASCPRSASWGQNDCTHAEDAYVYCANIRPSKRRSLSMTADEVDDRVVEEHSAQGLGQMRRALQDGNEANSDADVSVNAADVVSATFRAYGCTNQEAINFRPSASIDDGSCEVCDPRIIGTARVGVFEMNDFISCQYAPDDSRVLCGERSSFAAAVRFTAPVSSLFLFSTNGSSFDTILEIRDASCSSLALICNDDAGGGGLHSEAAVWLEERQTVIVVFGGWRASCGRLRLTLDYVRGTVLLVSPALATQGAGGRRSAFRSINEALELASGSGSTPLPEDATFVLQAGRHAPVLLPLPARAHVRSFSMQQTGLGSAEDTYLSCDGYGAALALSGLQLGVRVSGVGFRECTGFPEWRLPGGAVAVIDASPVFESCIFTSNEHDLAAGAVYVSGSRASPRFSRCAFRRNRAPSGGAVVVDAGASAEFFGCRFEENEQVGEGGRGGAALVGLTGPASASFDTAAFFYNVAESAGGALATATGPTGTAKNLANSTIVRESWFESNAAGEGGAVAVLGGARCALVGAVLRGNRAFVGLGGALLARGPGTEAVVLGGVLVENRALEGGAIAAAAGATVQVEGSAVVKNDAERARGAAIHCANSTLSYSSSYVTDNARAWNVTNVYCANCGGCASCGPCATCHGCAMDGSCTAEGLPNKGKAWCDDANLCTVDMCAADGSCLFTPVVCPAGQICNPEDGVCGTTRPPSRCEASTELRVPAGGFIHGTGPYASNALCKWRIAPPELASGPSTLYLFVSTRLEPVYDALAVSRADTPSDPVALFTGRAAAGPLEMAFDAADADAAAVVTFASDEDTNLDGLEVWYAARAKSATGSTVCLHGNLTSTMQGTFGFIEYAANDGEKPCTITIAPSGRATRVRLFLIRSGFAAEQRVEVYDGGDMRRERLAEFGGGTAAPPIASTGPKMTVRLDPAFSGASLLALWIAEYKGDEPCSGDVVLTDRSGVITPGFLPGGDKVRCSWTIDLRPSGASRVRLRVLELSTAKSEDVLELFDGAGAKAPRLDALSGVEGGLEWATSGPVAHVAFACDSSKPGSTFLLAYEGIASPGQEEAACAAAGALEAATQVMSQKAACRWGAALQSSDQVVGVLVSELDMAPAAFGHFTVGRSAFGNLEADPLAARFALSTGPFLVSMRYASGPQEFGAALSPPAAASRSSLHAIVHVGDATELEQTDYCGFATMTGLWGRVASGPAPYLANMECAWVIQPKAPSAAGIHLYFESIDTEESRDFIAVHNGVSSAGPRIALLSGRHTGLYLHSDMPAVYIVFRSDSERAGAGFAAQFFADPAPPAPAALEAAYAPLSFGDSFRLVSALGLDVDAGGGGREPLPTAPPDATPTPTPAPAPAGLDSGAWNSTAPNATAGANGTAAASPTPTPRSAPSPAASSSPSPTLRPTSTPSSTPTPSASEPPAEARALVATFAVAWERAPAEFDGDAFARGLAAFLRVGSGRVFVTSVTAAAARRSLRAKLTLLVETMVMPPPAGSTEPAADELNAVLRGVQDGTAAAPLAIAGFSATLLSTGVLVGPPGADSPKAFRPDAPASPAPSASAAPRSLPGTDGSSGSAPRPVGAIVGGVVGGVAFLALLAAGALWLARRRRQRRSRELEEADPKAAAATGAGAGAGSAAGYAERDVGLKLADLAAISMKETA